MLLSDKRILEELERGRVVIEPFEPRQLGTNSYDVRLGNHFYAANPYQKRVNFFDEESSRTYWVGPLHVKDWDTIPIHPGETVLAHTDEYIGGRSGVTSSMRARSSIGRSGLSVCKCAGVGDVGYVSRWTLEISNHGKATVYLPVHARIGQVLFYDVGETLREYAGKYGSRGEEKWTPKDMLPRCYLDWDLPKNNKEGPNEQTTQR